MVDGFIRSMIGDWGGAMLDFYIANDLWINGLILAYALLVGLGRYGFNRSVNFLLAHLRGTLKVDIAAKSNAELAGLIKRAKLPWDETARTAFPWLTPPGSFRPYLRSRATLEKLIPPELLAEQLKR